MRTAAMTITDVAHGLREDIVRAVEFATTRSMDAQLAGTVGIFAAGILVGAGIALFLTPKAGGGLHRDIDDGIAALRSRLTPPRSDTVPTQLFRRERSAAWPRRRRGAADWR
jgi:hypothetical protein